ncbi:MAG TPA: hypothetical protein VI488_00870 [Candidatus Angelobacter sp.]
MGGEDNANKLPNALCFQHGSGKKIAGIAVIARNRRDRKPKTKDRGDGDIKPLPRITRMAADQKPTEEIAGIAVIARNRRDRKSKGQGLRAKKAKS